MRGNDRDGVSEITCNQAVTTTYYNPIKILKGILMSGKLFRKNLKIIDRSDKYVRQVFGLPMVTELY